jgi:pyrroloquinoline quinone (PQQ) biosynthesis protein C
MTASRRLQAKVELAAPALNAAAEPVWLGPDAARLYPVYLARLHGVAAGAVPLMRRALEVCDRLDDACTRVLAPFLEHHIPEELGHDEWLLDDIAALGGDADEVRRRTPSSPAAGANGAQLWWIEHAHPVALLGHAEVLECSPPAIEMLDEFEARTGLSREGMMFFRRHAEIDVRHREEIHATLDALPLSEEQEALIGMSALHTAAALVDLYRTVR